MSFPFTTRLTRAVLLAAMTWGTAVNAAEPLRIGSPDGKVVVAFSLDSAGTPVFSVSNAGRAVVIDSKMGLEPGLLSGFRVKGTGEESHDSRWDFAFGERSEIVDRFNDLTVDLEHETGVKLGIVFRAYDEGAALRYVVPEHQTDELRLSGERTEFRLPPGTIGYEEHGTEGVYHRVPVSKFKPFCERPVTLEYPDGGFATLTEAANVGYARTLFSPASGAEGGLVTALGGNTSNTESPNQRHDPNVVLKPGEATPWRVLIVGDRPGDLLERNYILLNLNPPCALDDVSWIKPGKVMRSAKLTTENAKAVVDLAEVAGLSYVHFDTGWYGHERDREADATTIDEKLTEVLDLHEVVRYGQQRGVGVLVYVNQVALLQQLDELLPRYREWGIKGIKFGFVRVGPQLETQWITDAVAKAAEHQLMLNIHDGYRATGNTRTYPNLMTVEGIRGNEHMPTAEHNCTLPFTRYVTGIGDYTVCYYNNRIKTTHAHQLAMAVVSFSPLQWIFWYDTPDLYRGEPEVAFFREVPTVWDETRVLHGEIGKFATIARRSGDAWFVGTINASEPRTLRIPLDFLETDRQYVARIYSDDETAPTRTKVGVEVRPVDSKSVLDVPLVPSGGQAIWIEPKQEGAP